MVEDNDVIRANLTETLQELAGVNIVGFADEAGPASRWLIDHPQAWKLAIVDLFLRTGNGLAVLSAVQKRQAAQRMIIVSNYATPEMRLRCLAAGADAIFDKSTEVDALVQYCLECGA